MFFLNFGGSSNQSGYPGSRKLVDLENQARLTLFAVVSDFVATLSIDLWAITDTVAPDVFWEANVPTEDSGHTTTFNFNTVHRPLFACTGKQNTLLTDGMITQTK